MNRMEAGPERKTPGAIRKTFTSAGKFNVVRAACSVLLIHFFLHATYAHAMSGREVYEKVHEVRSRALDRKTEATMALFDRGEGSGPGPSRNTARKGTPRRTRCWWYSTPLPI